MHRDSLQPYLKYRPGMMDSAAMHSDAVKSSGVRILNVGGWFDASPAGALLGWQLWGGRVIIGPWTHGATTGPNPAFTNSGLDRAALYTKWYDYTLKGIRNGFDSAPPVAYYTINAPKGKEWRRAAQWPLANAQPTRFYFAEGKTGTVHSLNDGMLTRSAPTGTAVDSYDPDYSASLFDGKFIALKRYWDGDMRASTDEKGLTYTMAPLASDLEVTGHPIVNMWVSSTSKDEDFFAVLEDVAPDGKSTYVTEGKIRASRRKLEVPPWGDTGLPYHPQREGEDEALDADKPAQLLFDILPTSYVFKRGHRIRLAIINSGGPAFQAPPGQDRKAPPSIRVLRTATHPSYISLPIVPKGSSVYRGKLTIHTADLRYTGPGAMYTAPKGTYIQYGDKWLKYGESFNATKSTYQAQGATGTVLVSLTQARSGQRSATVNGGGVAFSGDGDDAE